MTIREATLADVGPIQLVRNAVKENRLSNPNLVTDDDCREFLFIRGKGWVCEVGKQVVGFSIVDLRENNVWALFVDPLFEKRGIGRMLHDTMLNWYFSQTNADIWLGTAPNTRAAVFYKESGWQETGIHGKNEIKFEMTLEQWISRKAAK